MEWFLQKIGVMLLAVVLTAGLIGCGNIERMTDDGDIDNQNPENEGSLDTVISLTVTGPEDLRGRTIVYASMDEHFVAAGSDHGKVQVEHILAGIQEKYGFTLEWKKTEPYNITPMLITALQSGSKFADFMQPYLVELVLGGSAFESRALRDISKFSEEFDLYNPEIYSQDYLDETRLYGKNLFVFGNYQIPQAQYLVFNKNILIEDCGMQPEELYQIVRDGSWTISRMQSLARNAVKKNVAGPNNFADQYGFSGWDMLGSVSSNVYIAAGGRSCVKNPADGSFIYVFDNAESLAAMNTMQNWLLKDPSVFYIRDGNDQGYGNEHQRLFVEGRSLFLGSVDYWDPMAPQDSVLPGVSGFDWGIVPYPKPNENEPYRSHATNSAPCYAIPSNNSDDEVALVGYLLRELIPLLEVAHMEERQETRDKYYAYDPAIIEMRDNYINASSYLDPMYWGGAGGSLSIIHAVMGGNADPAQQLAAHGPVFSRATADFNRAFREAR